MASPPLGRGPQSALALCSEQALRR